MIGGVLNADTRLSREITGDAEKGPLANAGGWGLISVESSRYVK